MLSETKHLGVEILRHPPLGGFLRMTARDEKNTTIFHF